MEIIWPIEYIIWCLSINFLSGAVLGYVVYSWISTMLSSLHLPEHYIRLYSWSCGAVSALALHLLWDMLGVA